MPMSHSRSYRAQPSVTRAHLLLALLVLMSQPAASPALLLGASVIPHGDFAWLPSLLPEGSANRSIAEFVRSGAMKAAALLREASPEVILVIAPHAAALSTSFALYANSGVAGTALLGGDLHNATQPLVAVPLAAAGAPELAVSLATTLAAAHNVSDLTFWGDSEPAPLRWSEIVPLAFLDGFVNASTGGAQVLVWSQPTKRLTCASCMVPELISTGAALAAALAATPQRIWLLVSADLAHTHPAAVNPYPANASAAAAFDAAASSWAAALDAHSLLVTAAQVTDYALSCGFTGMVLAHAALAAAPGGLAAWQPELFAYGAPTYYGMLAAHFGPRGVAVSSDESLL